MEEKSYLYYDADEKLHLGVFHDKNGKLCPYYFLKDRIFKKASAYASMKKDLVECVEAIEYLITIMNDPRFPQVAKSSLLFASVVKYARCFTSGEGRGTSLNADDVFKGDKVQHRDFHDEVMELRHKYLAHAGESFHEDRAFAAILNPDKNNKAVEKLHYAGFHLKDDNSNIDKYLGLYKCALDHVIGKIEHLRPVLNEKVKEMDIDQLYADSKVPEWDKLIPFPVNII